METFDLWTDGACSAVVGKGQKAKGAGGWAVIVIPQGGLKMGYCGWEAQTTNNRMELMAVIKGLEALGEMASGVRIHTDSAYVKNGYTRWLPRWKANGWISSRGDGVSNRDLWERLDDLVRRHFVEWRKVKGHGTTVLNIQADAMAVNAKHARIEEAKILP